ncbi:MAG: CCA tRNA nucleotidyltransferase [bacterium]
MHDPVGIKPGDMKLDLSLVPEPVKRLQELLGPAKSYVVGGILRDSLGAARPGPEGIISRITGNDWDLATPLRPREVLTRLRRAGVTAVPIGFEHGTVAAVIEGVSHEITTFRYDLEYRDGRHPTVRFADSLEDDLMRRDFTVNSLALDLESGEILDLFGGLRDLQDRIIRTVGDPEVRFREDYLRMLRAARFAAKLEGVIDPETRAAVLRNAPLIQNVSPERVREEILKLLTYRQPSQGFEWMQATGLLLYILPELESGFGVGQNRFHADDVARHTLHAVDALDPRYPFLRFVTLMHDLGKVPAKRYMPHKGDYVFYGHQYVSKRMTRRIMRRLRFSNKEIETATAIVENHMYNLKPDLSEGASRRFIRKLGRENVEGFLRLRMADRKGNHLNEDGYEKGIFHFVRSLRKITRADDALTVQKLRINGYDLMEMGLIPGPVFSRILNGILEEVLDNPSLNEREYLLGRARKIVQEYQRTGDIQIQPPSSTPEEEDGEEA